MASATSISAQIAQPSEGTARTTIEFLGLHMEIPLPKWAIACLAVLLIATVAVTGIYWLHNRITGEVLVPEAQMNAYEESYFHSAELGELKASREETFDSTRVTVNYFKSDGCVQVVRTLPNGKHDAPWIFGPNPHFAENHGDHALNSSFQQGKPQASPAAATDLKLISYEPKLEFAEDRPHPAPLRRVAGENCPNPHPGKFSARTEQVSKCSVKVWRTFEDGCVHYQYFNPCAGTWEVNADGSPRVVWTKCVH